MITIRSVDRHTTSASSADARFILTTPLELGATPKLRRLRLEYAQVYNTPYLIQSDVNDRINFSEAGGARVATLTAGYYNATTLATEMAAKMSAAPGATVTYTVTYSSVTGKFTWTGTAAFTLLPLTGVNAALNPWKILGLMSTNGGAAVDGTTGTSYTAPYPAN
jgi:hypothetical protein